jgi:hypothetical protein
MVNNTYFSSDIKHRESVIYPCIAYLESQLKDSSLVSQLSEEQLSKINQSIDSGKSLDLLEQGIDNSVYIIDTLVNKEEKTKKDIDIIKQEIEQLLLIKNKDYDYLRKVTAEELTKIDDAISSGNTLVSSL